MPGGTPVASEGVLTRPEPARPPATAGRQGSPARGHRKRASPGGGDDQGAASPRDRREPRAEWYNVTPPLDRAAGDRGEFACERPTYLIGDSAESNPPSVVRRAAATRGGSPKRQNPTPYTSTAKPETYAKKRRTSSRLEAPEGRRAQRRRCWGPTGSQEMKTPGTRTAQKPGSPRSLLPRRVSDEGAKGNRPAEGRGEAGSPEWQAARARNRTISENRKPELQVPSTEAPSRTRLEVRRRRRGQKPNGSPVQRLPKPRRVPSSEAATSLLLPVTKTPSLTYPPTDPPTSLTDNRG